MKRKFKIKTTHFFVITSLVFGFLMLLLTPPMQGPDEPAHFVQAYRIARGELVSGVEKNPEATIAVSIKSTMSTLLHGKYDVRFDANKKYQLDVTRQLLNMPLNEEKQTKAGDLTGTGYPFVTYFPQAIMIQIGRISNLSPVALMYLGRVGSLLSWITLVYLAIRIAPVGKKVLCCIALLPMSIFQASMLSADALPSALLLLFVALIIRYYDKQALNLSRLIMLGSVGLAMTACKPVYGLLLPLMGLLIFRDSTKRRRINMMMFAKLTGTVITSGLLAGGLYIVLGGGGGTVDMMPENVDATRQLNHLFPIPNEFLYAFWNTNAFTWGDSITRSFVGTFGWVDVQPPLTFTILCYIMLFIVLFANRESDYARLKAVTRVLPRTLLILLLLGFYVITSLVLYMFYTPVDFHIIVGLQGRYFLPLLTIAYFIFINNDGMKLNQRTYRFFTMALPVLLLLTAVANIYIRYYYNTLI